MWDSGGGAGKGGAAGFLSSLGQSIPPLLDVMKSVGGVDMPTYFGKLQGDAAEPSGAAAQAKAPGAAAEPPRS